MQSIYDFILRLFGADNDVDAIVKPIAKVEQRLLRHARRQETEAQNNEARAEQLREAAKAKAVDADKARHLAFEYGRLTGR